jgi:hypothetical protein
LTALGRSLFDGGVMITLRPRVSDHRRRDEEVDRAGNLEI